MNPIEILKKEHEEIERELIELETIMNEGEINYPNLIYVYKKLLYLWDAHEEKEEKIFPALEKEEIIIPVERMQFDHMKLRPHKETIYNAINSGSDFEVKRALENSGATIIRELREHMNNEENVLFIITLDMYDEEELKRALDY